MYTCWDYLYFLELLIHVGNYIYMLWLKLIHFSKSGPWIIIWNNKTTHVIKKPHTIADNWVTLQTINLPHSEKRFMQDSSGQILFWYKLQPEMENMLSGILSCANMRPANERRRHIVTSPLIGWAHAQNDPWWYYISILQCVNVCHFGDILSYTIYAFCTKTFHFLRFCIYQALFYWVS